jgi:hypothetical protein
MTQNTLVALGYLERVPDEPSDIPVEPVAMQPSSTGLALPTKNPGAVPLVPTTDIVLDTTVA